MVADDLSMDNKGNTFMPVVVILCVRVYLQGLSRCI